MENGRATSIMLNTLDTCSRTYCNSQLSRFFRLHTYQQYCTLDEDDNVELPTWEFVRPGYRNRSPAQEDRQPQTSCASFLLQLHTSPGRYEQLRQHSN